MGDPLPTESTPSDTRMIRPKKNRETEILFLVEEGDEGGYIARSLKYPIYTQGDTLDDLKEMVHEAVICHFGDTPAPALIRLHIVKDVVIAV